MKINYRNHPTFKKPENINCRIWRYMDFIKFVSMLDKSGLFFSRLDRLGDPFEGSVPLPNLEVRRQIKEEHIMPDHILDNFGKFLQWMRRWTFVNCWHMNEFESAAMWKLYSQSTEAIAIRSTYKVLDDCIGEQCFVGTIKYIDYATQTIPESILYYLFLHKRMSFAHEKELRALIVDTPNDNKGIEYSSEPKIDGKWIEVDLDRLITDVYLAPTAQSWLQELVQNVCTKYGLKKEIKKSSLTDQPLY